MNLAYWKINLLLLKLKIFQLEIYYWNIKTKILGKWTENIIKSSEWETFSNEEDEVIFWPSENLVRSFTGTFLGISEHGDKMVKRFGGGICVAIDMEKL